MTGTAFLAKVREHPSLEYVDILEDQVIVRFSPFLNVSSSAKHSIMWGIDPKSLLDSPWEELLEVLLGNRSPLIMKQITRIVGYYAYLRNWNKSKIAELADRHAGNYGIPMIIEVAA